MSIEPVAWFDKKRNKSYPKEFYDQYKNCEVGSAGFDLIKDLHPLVLKSDYDELQRQLAERDLEMEAMKLLGVMDSSKLVASLKEQLAERDEALRELCLRVAMEVAQNYDGMTIEAIVDEVLAE